jgi:DNA-binding LacI/PurR family transcriptional regulator
MTKARQFPGGTGRTTMQDVAQLAGVSQQTVSRVINGAERVTPETVERVERAIEKLGFKRNAAARALKTSRSMRLGVISFGTTLFGPATILFGIIEAARSHKYSTTLVSLEDNDLRSLRESVELLREENVDGIVVLAPIAGAAAMAELLVNTVPMVLFEPGLDNGTTSVSVDEVEGARLATRHLIELGHKTVWHVSGPSGWLGTEARIAGWQQELSVAGLPMREPIMGDWSVASGYKAGLQLADQEGVTSVFVANDQMALGLMRALRDRGLSVPDDISVVGFDDVPEAEYFAPALTTVKLDFSEVGHRCVERLLDIIDGKKLDPQPAVPPEIKRRLSSSPPRR